MAGVHEDQLPLPQPVHVLETDLDAGFGLDRQRVRVHGLQVPAALRAGVLHRLGAVVDAEAAQGVGGIPQDPQADERDRVLQHAGLPVHERQCAQAVDQDERDGPRAVPHERSGGLVAQLFQELHPGNLYLSAQGQRLQRGGGAPEGQESGTVA